MRCAAGTRDDLCEGEVAVAYIVERRSPPEMYKSIHFYCEKHARWFGNYSWHKNGKAITDRGEVTALHAHCLLRTLGSERDEPSFEGIFSLPVD